DDDFGNFPGTLPLSLLGLHGRAVTPHPAIVVNFRAYSSGCDEPTNCSVEVADTVLRQGQGMHGSFSRGDTMNFMAACRSRGRRFSRPQAPAFASRGSRYRFRCEPTATTSPLELTWKMGIQSLASTGHCWFEANVLQIRNSAANPSA